MPNLDRIAAALNAYPWARGCLTSMAGDVPRYCAVGGLLRYAGVSFDDIRQSSGSPSAVWRAFSEALHDEYAIDDAQTLRFIMIANDSSPSRDVAIARVLGVLDGSVDLLQDRLAMEWLGRYCAGAGRGAGVEATEAA